MKYTKYIIFSCAILISILITSCNSCSHNQIKGISASATIYRFDSLFYAINEPAKLTSAIQKVMKEDSFFYALYLEKLFNMNLNDPNLDRMVFNHINSKQNQEVRKLLMSKEEKLSKVKKELDLIARYYKLHYPKRTFPELVTCFSGFAGFNAWLYNENKMLIDLDMYLGSDFEAYPQFYPEYKFRYYDLEFLPQNVARELVRREFLEIEKEKPINMLALMLIEGAKVYEQSKLMPCREVHNLFEYTAEQWEWAKREEKNIWQYLIKEKLLFESDFNKYRPMIGEAPNTLRSGVAEGAPPRIAIFAGYQIITKFLEQKNLKSSFGIFAKYSPEEIMKIAKYKP